LILIDLQSFRKSWLEHELAIAFGIERLLYAAGQKVHAVHCFLQTLSLCTTVARSMAYVAHSLTQIQRLLFSELRDDPFPVIIYLL
jgi:hypothetical protein